MRVYLARRIISPTSSLALAFGLCLLLTVTAGAVAEEPGDPQASMTARGRVTFRIYCVNCHGEKGAGDGSVAELLTVKPTDLTQMTLQNGGQFPADKVRRSIDGRETIRGHGDREMPIWGDALQETLQTTWKEVSDEDRAEAKIEDVVAFIESIQASEEP